ncbi:MAG TPA: NAD(P)-dependent oxidoreductase [Spirochaetia bacterium]|nr:NAD(P)-dependent oxidoreductase [Spirochaetia bacterium]
MRIGFAGLGIMGSRMAANLARAGHEMTVWNRSAGKEPAGLAAVRRAHTPAEAAREAEVFITMLATPAAVSTVALGDQGFLGALPRGALWIDSSTVDPSFSRTMAEEAGRRGVRFMDAPVSGSRGPAERGELTFLVGASAEDVVAARPLLERMGKLIVHAGPVSMGAALKLVVNLMLANAMAAFCEALTLGEALGLQRGKILDTLLGGPVTAPVLSAKRERLEARRYEDADFPLKWMHKDLHLAAAAAYENGVALPVSNAVKELFAMAAETGRGEADFSAIEDFVSRMRAP